MARSKLKFGDSSQDIDKLITDIKELCDGIKKAKTLGEKVSAFYTRGQRPKSIDLTKGVVDLDSEPIDLTEKSDFRKSQKSSAPPAPPRPLASAKPSAPPAPQSQASKNSSMFTFFTKKSTTPSSGKPSSEEDCKHRPFKTPADVVLSKTQKLPGGRVHIRFLSKPLSVYNSESGYDRDRIKEPLVKKDGNFVVLSDDYDNMLRSQYNPKCTISGPYSNIFDFNSGPNSNTIVCNNVIGNEGTQNRIVVVFGLSGSGKTYTLMGTDQNPGLIPCFIKSMGNTKIECSSVQVYKGDVYDTLGVYVGKRAGDNIKTNNDPFTYINEESKLKIDTKKYDQNEDELSNVFGSLNKKSFTGYEEFKQIYETIKGNRPTRSTKLNPESSRSHLFIFFKIGNQMVTFVDLGGYEQPQSTPKNSTEEEGNFINGELQSIKIGLKQMLNNKPLDTIGIAPIGIRTGAYKIFNYLSEKKPKLDVVLCTQYYQLDCKEINKGTCSTFRKNSDQDNINKCIYYERLWSLTNKTLQFGNDLIIGTEATLQPKFGSKPQRRRSYHKKVQKRVKVRRSSLRKKTV